MSRIIQRNISRDDKLEKEMTDYAVKEGQPPYSKSEIDEVKANMRSMKKERVIERSKMTKEERKEERDEANQTIRQKVQKNIELLQGDVSDAVTKIKNLPMPVPSVKLSFSEFKNIITKSSKTSSDIESLIKYAQTNQANINKYLNKNNYKGAKTIDELVSKLRENIPSQTKGKSKPPTIGTPVIQQKKTTMT
jgi:hypothetical protein